MKNMIDKIHYKTQNVGPAITRPHFHSGYEILFVLEGQAEIEINRYLHPVKSPAIILLNPFEWHRIIYANKQYKRYSLVLKAEEFEQSVHAHLVAMIKCRPLGFRHIISLDTESTKEIESILNTLISENQNNRIYKEQMIANNICSLLILLYRLRGKDPVTYNERIIKIQQYIDMHYKTIGSVGELSQQFYISREYLTRAFKKFSGYSPVEYLLYTRLYHAQMLLLNTEKNLTEICEDVGFGDPNNFIRQFKKKYDVTPLAFRKINRTAVL